MTEEKEEIPTPFDAEWEIAKHRARFTDILNMIEELKAKDRTLSARISRLRIRSIEEEGEEEEAPEEEEMLSKIEKMSLEERAIYLSETIDRLRPPPP